MRFIEEKRFRRVKMGRISVLFGHGGVCNATTFLHGDAQGAAGFISQSSGERHLINEVIRTLAIKGRN